MLRYTVATPSPGACPRLSAADLDRNYTSVCDPRLNYRQAMEMAFRVGSWMSEAVRAPSAARARRAARAVPVPALFGAGQQSAPAGPALAAPAVPDDLPLL